MRELNWIELVALIIVIKVILFIIIYYGYMRVRHAIRECLISAHNVAVFPITISLITSYISCITLLGIPTEVYYYGTQYLLVVVMNVVVVLVVLHIYLPVFYELQFNSVYEYLEQRFNSKIRGLMSLLFALANILSIPLTVYMSALAYNQAFGTSVHLICTIKCVMCVIHTAFSGVKSIVLLDVIQIVLNFFPIIIVVILGLQQVGGIGNIITTNQEENRIEFFKMNPDPFLRNSFWTVSLGITLYRICDLGLHPDTMKRFVALPTYKKARNALIYYVIGVGVVQILSGLFGLIIYTKYKGCDPSLSNYIDNDRQLVQYYVMDMAKNIPGVAGFFISGIIGTCLNKMSIQLDTVAGTIYEDFVVKLMGVKVSDKVASIIVKSIIVVVGIICLVLIMLIERLKGIIQLMYSLTGITTGGILSVFTLGVCFPRANSKGAMCGLLASFGVMAWIVIGAQLAMFNNELMFVEKNVSTAECPANITLKNQTDFSGLYRMNEDVYVEPNVWKIYTISYMHYSTLGTLVGIIVGLAVSSFSIADKRVDPRLLAPCVRKFVRPIPHVSKSNLDIIESEEHQL